MLRNGVWTRAEVVAEEMRAMEAEVPGLDSNPKVGVRRRGSHRGVR